MDIYQYYNELEKRVVPGMEERVCMLLRMVTWKLYNGQSIMVVRGMMTHAIMLQ
jgi:hypothetical protein